MNPSSIDTLKNNFFEIQNVNSSFNQYYHLTSPYNAVIETYRSDLDQPYFKISSFSPEHTSHSLIDATELLEKMKNRPPAAWVSILCCREAIANIVSIIV